MTSSNPSIYSLKVLAQTGGEIVLFPVWWYGQGLLRTIGFFYQFLVNRQKSLALGVWMKNIFTPMYGQHDFAGVMISVLIRIVQIAVRGLILFLYALFCLLLIMLWIFCPIYIFYQLLFQLGLI